MTTTTITVASFQTACAECADAIAAENKSLAYKWYARAEAINSGLEVSVGDQGASIRRRESLAGLKDSLAVVFAVIASSSDDERRIITTRTSHG